MLRAGRGLGLGAKVGIAVRVWWSFVVVHVGLRRRPLPDLVRELGRPRGTWSSGVGPGQLGLIVFRLLRLGRRRARCLISALVLFRLLRLEGRKAELVIGLPETPLDRNAHAWIEIDGVDVGPPPGRSGHEELARYS